MISDCNVMCVVQLCNNTFVHAQMGVTASDVRKVADSELVFSGSVYFCSLGYF